MSWLVRRVWSVSWFVGRMGSKDLKTLETGSTVSYFFSATDFFSFCTNITVQYTVLILKNYAGVSDKRCGALIIFRTIPKKNFIL